MSDMKRIRTVSAVMRAVCTISIVAIPVSVAAFWAMASPDTVKALPGISYEVSALPPATRGLAFVVTMVPGTVAVWGLVALRGLFDAYRRGAIFAPGNALRLRNFAVSVVVAAIAKIAIVPVMSVVLSWHNPPGSRALSIAFGSDDIGGLFVGFLFLVVAWIMAEAQRLAEDNAQIV